MAAIIAAAPNSLLASLRWHLCRSCNQAFVGCLVNATKRKNSRALDLESDELQIGDKRKAGIVHAFGCRLGGLRVDG